VVTLGIAFQMVGTLAVLSGALAIGYGGLPRKDVARAHGTYGGAKTIWRALGREHGYVKGGLIVTFLGAAINISGLVVEVPWSTDARYTWVIPLLVGLIVGVLGYYLTYRYATCVAEEWSKNGES
jgi:hypothetical protein